MAGSELPVRIVDADGKQITNFGSSVGPTPAASSQSVTPATDSAPFPVVGNVAAGAADVGNPVRNGGTVRVAVTNYADGQRAPLALTMNGAQHVGGFSQFGVDQASSQTVFLWGQDGNARPLATLNYVSPSSGAAPVVMRGDSIGTYVVRKGGSNIATGQAAVTTASTLVAAARPGRQNITLTPTSATVYYVGATGVTATTGVYVAAGGSITLDTAAAVYAVGASALTISYIELY